MQLLVVGRRSYQGGQWAEFDFGELDDFFSGVPKGAEIHFHTGPVPAALSGALRELAAKHALSVIEAAADLDREAWQLSVEATADRMAPAKIVLMTAAEDYLTVGGKLADRGYRTLAFASHNEPTRLIRAAGPDTARQNAGLIDALAKMSVVLTTSPWECQELDMLTGGETQVFAYLRGVDLHAFTPVARSGNGPLRVLYVADRGGPVSLRHVSEAAKQIGPEANVRFTIVSPNLGPDVGWLEHRAMPAVGQGSDFYAGFDALLMPAECTGFSQSLMEACASGCAIIAPESYFGDYAGEVPFLTYSVRAGQLAATVARLERDRNLLRTLRERAPEFARTHFDQNEWRRWLEQCIAWLGAPGDAAATGSAA